MKYETYIVDVHEDWYMESDGVPCEAPTQWDAFEAAIKWTRENNVMRSYISITSPSPVCNK